MDEVPSVTKAVESGDDEWPSSLLHDHFYMRSNRFSQKYHVLQPVSHAGNAEMNLSRQESTCIIVTAPHNLAQQPLATDGRVEQAEYQMTNKHKVPKRLGWCLDENSKVSENTKVTPSTSATSLQREDTHFSCGPLAPLAVAPSTDHSLASNPGQRQDSTSSVGPQTALHMPVKEAVVTPQQPSGTPVMPAYVLPMKLDQPSPRGGVYGQSMYSMMRSQQSLQPSDQYNMRTTNLMHLFQRLKKKIIYLQNSMLGDLQISASSTHLNQTLDVIMQHYESAQMDPTKVGAFIDAVHRCESPIDKAIVCGKNLPRNIFLDDWKKITEEYSHAIDPAVAQELPQIQTKTPTKYPQRIPSRNRGFAYSVDTLSKDNATVLAELGIRQKKEGSLNTVLQTRSVTTEPDEIDAKESTMPDWEKSLKKIIKERGIPIEAGDDKMSTGEKLVQKLLSVDSPTEKDGMAVGPGLSPLVRDVRQAEPVYQDWDCFLNDLLDLEDECRNRRIASNSATVCHPTSKVDSTCYTNATFATPMRAMNQVNNPNSTNNVAISVPASVVAATPTPSHASYPQPLSARVGHVGKARRGGSLRTHGNPPSYMNRGGKDVKWVQPQNRVAEKNEAVVQQEEQATMTEPFIFSNNMVAEVEESGFSSDQLPKSHNR